MHEQLSLEQRVAAVEDETPVKETSNWLDHVVGSMRDYPEWEEVLRLGAEIRRADRMSYDR